MPNLAEKTNRFPNPKGNLGSFSDSFMVNQLTVKKVYIRAYARNSKGTSYGTSIPVRLEKPLPTLAWADASRRPDADDWWESPWLGAIYALRRMDGFFIRIYTGYLSSHNHRVRESGYGRKELAGFGPENQLSRIYFLMPLNLGYSYMDRRRMVPFFLIIKMRTGSS